MYTQFLFGEQFYCMMVYVDAAPADFFHLYIVNTFGVVVCCIWPGLFSKYEYTQNQIT